MANQLHEDGLGQKGLGKRAFAEKHGLSEKLVTIWCRDGKIFGARKHPITKKWWIYPPAKLLCEPRKRRVNTSTPMLLISPDAKQA